jgi:uncharacterized protein (DUF1697 family)
MPAYIVLLRAVNVGGTGKLPMAELKAMCVAAGFSKVQTYIASGNVVFESKLNAKRIRALLGARLESYAGRPVGLVIRTSDEMVAVLKANPFPKVPQNSAVAIFLDDPPPPGALAEAKGLNGEEMHLGAREIYVSYGEGMGQSKLRIPAAKAGTARNMNTVAKLAALAAAL